MNRERGKDEGGRDRGRRTEGERGERGGRRRGGGERGIVKEQFNKLILYNIGHQKKHLKYGNDPVQQT